MIDRTKRQHVYPNRMRLQVWTLAFGCPLSRFVADVGVLAHGTTYKYAKRDDLPLNRPTAAGFFARSSDAYIYGTGAELCKAISVSPVLIVDRCREHGDIHPLIAIECHNLYTALSHAFPEGILHELEQRADDRYRRARETSVSLARLPIGARHDRIWSWHRSTQDAGPLHGQGDNPHEEDENSRLCHQGA